MRVAIAAAVTGLALCSLAACNRPASAPAGAAAPAPLTANQMPQRKPGLWRQVMTMDGNTPAGPGMQLCIDAASEAEMSTFSHRMPGAANCPPAQFTHNLDGSLSFTESCDTGAKGRETTTGVIKGDFNSSYTEQMDTQYSGSPVAAVNGEHKLTLTATWVGPCPPGERGGDLILPNGMKRNILDAPAPTSGATN
jgi:hypothetical protein